MKIFLIRHGAYASSDITQPLTPQGASDVKKVAVFLKEQNLSVEEIWHSPKLRAAESAQIVADVYACNHVVVKDCLTPNADPDEALEDLKTSTKNVAIVSHLPFIPNILSRIFPQGMGSPFFFPTASVAVLEHQSGQWKFCEMITPDYL